MCGAAELFAQATPMQRQQGNTAGERIETDEPDADCELIFLQRLRMSKVCQNIVENARSRRSPPQGLSQQIDRLTD